MATDQLPALPEPKTLSRGDEDGAIQLGYTADQMRAYARAAIAADRARAVPVSSGEVAVLAMVTFTMLGDLMGDEAPPEAVEFAKELYPRIDEIQEFAPGNADVLRVAMAHLRAWLSGAGAAPEHPADLSGQAATAAGEREAFEAWAAANGFNTHRDESDKYSDYHRATTRFAWQAWQARASLATPASGEGWMPAKQAPESPEMGEGWSVTVSRHGVMELTISDKHYCGGSDLDDGLIVGAAQHLLAFVGYGLPPCSFDPDDDPTSPTEPAAEGDAA